MEIELGNYRPIDKPYLWDIYVSALRNYIDEMWNWDQSWQENKFEESLKKYQTKVIYYHGIRVGYTQIEKMEECTDISMLILEPDFQSKGIGSKILDILQPDSPDLSLRLNCFQVNVRAYRFYLRCGFKVLKTDDKLIYMQREKNA